MDLSNKTYLELIELRQQINQEIQEAVNRKKVKVYSICSFGDTENYIEKPNADLALRELFEDDEVVWSEDGVQSKVIYIDSAQLKYCKDYKEDNG